MDKDMKEIKLGDINESEILIEINGVKKICLLDMWFKPENEIVVASAQLASMSEFLIHWDKQPEFKNE